MLLTIIPDWHSIDSVRRAHSRFELGGIVFFALLAIAEGFAHNEKDKKREHWFNTFGVWFFAIAVACEIAGYVYGQRNDSLSEGKITSLDALAHDAAGTARASKTTADGANTVAGQAQTKAEGAKTAADEASGLAKGARTEADSFEQRIEEANKASANSAKAATDAVSRLAEAENKLDTATKRELADEGELNRLKTPRSIGRSADLIASLKRFKGTKYVFVTVFQDEEAINLLREIDEALQQAGWLRDKSIPGFPAINVYGKDRPDFSVVVGFNTGIQISTESRTPLATLQATPFNDAPLHCRPQQL